MTTQAQPTNQSLWEEASNALSQWKELELGYRLALVAEKCIKEEAGTENVTLDDGRTLNVVHTDYWKLQNKNGETQTLAASMEPTVAATLFNWEPKLNKKAFRQIQSLAAQEGEAGGPNTELIKSIEALLTIDKGKPQVKIK